MVAAYWFQAYMWWCWLRVMPTSRFLVLFYEIAYHFSREKNLVEEKLCELAERVLGSWDGWPVDMFDR
jgi:hypothetical protein